MDTIVAIRDLGLAYTRDGTTTRVLAGLDLAIRRGEVLVIVGESGVGKSTLLRVLIGLVQPNTGTVAVTPKTNGGRATMGLVFQDARLLPWRSVLDNVAFGLERLGLTTEQRRQKAQAMLDLVGLGALGTRWPHELSGGQRQRVALARALAIEPDLLLMDEPFSALDSLTREALQNEVQRIQLATNTTLVFVTHDIDEAVFLADRVIVLAGSPGRLVATIDLDVPRPRRRDDPHLAASARTLRVELSGGSAAL